MASESSGTPAAAEGSVRFFFSQPSRSETRPAIFLDRDGVINERIIGGYVTDWSQFRFVPGIVAALTELSGLGLPIIVVSNQACVSKGFLSRATLEGITRRFVRELNELGARVDAVYYCPHAPKENCRCRKPKPGLLENAARDWGSELSGSVLIGDSLSDVSAARAAGCKAVLLVREGWESGCPPSDAATVRDACEIYAAVRRLFYLSENS